MRNYFIGIIFIVALSLGVSCGKKKLTNKTSETVDNKMIQLSALGYERVGDCGPGTTHKVVQVGGIVSTSDEENFFVTDFQLALYFDERRYDYYESRYSGAGNDTDFFHEERDTGLLEVFDDTVKLVGLGSMKLEFNGENIRPILELDAARVPDTPRRDYVARVVETSATKIYPSCTP